MHVRKDRRLVPAFKPAATPLANTSISNGASEFVLPASCTEHQS